MNYALILDVIELIDSFHQENNKNSLQTYPDNLTGFKQFVAEQFDHGQSTEIEPNWEGKENGRSAESAINTLVVHMNRYAKMYAKSAIHQSNFSTQEEFIFLINLKTFGAMSKMELIKKNIQDKPVGIQIINRIIKHGWVDQSESQTDKRTKVLQITPKGMAVLDQQMDKIRVASKIVTGKLNQKEKLQLIRLLNKLNDYHQDIYKKNYDIANLLEKVQQFHS